MDKKRIMVVDDEERLTKIVKLNLEASGLFEVRTENKGAVAVESIRRFKPDVILLDVVMPDIDGSQVAQEILSDKSLKDIPIIFLTAVVSSQEVANANGIIGGQSFLAKPINAQKLIEAIKERINC